MQKPNTKGTKNQLMNRVYLLKGDKKYTCFKMIWIYQQSYQTVKTVIFDLASEKRKENSLLSNPIWHVDFKDVKFSSW